MIFSKARFEEAERYSSLIISVNKNRLTTAEQAGFQRDDRRAGAQHEGHRRGEIEE
jgi:hypothetical protein